MGLYADNGPTNLLQSWLEVHYVVEAQLLGCCDLMASYSSL